MLWRFICAINTICCKPLMLTSNLIVVHKLYWLCVAKHQSLMNWVWALEKNLTLQANNINNPSSWLAAFLAYLILSIYMILETCTETSNKSTCWVPMVMFTSNISWCAFNSAIPHLNMAYQWNKKKYVNGITSWISSPSLQWHYHRRLLSSCMHCWLLWDSTYSIRLQPKYMTVHVLSSESWSTWEGHSIVHSSWTPQWRSSQF